MREAREMIDPSRLDAHFAAGRVRHLDELGDFIRIPTVSALQ